MAIKRMFDREVVRTDRFADMPNDSKALYFLLGMEADDEGFVGHRSIMRAHNIPQDAAGVLIQKGLVYPFSTGVVVITDWHNNNYLQRIKSTVYQDERKMLEIEESQGGDARYKVQKYVVKQEYRGHIQNGVIQVEQSFNNCLTDVKQPLDICLTDVKPEERRGVERSREERSRENTSTSQSAVQVKPKKSKPQNTDQEKHNPEGAKIIEAFIVVDPKNESYYNRKDQRAACDFLIRHYTLEETLKRIGALTKTNKISYFPVITTPCQLRDSWKGLEAAATRFHEQRGTKKQSGTVGDLS